MTILDEIAAKTRLRLAMEKIPPEQMREQALALTAKKRGGALQHDSASLTPSIGSAAVPLPFERALAASGLSFICEVKKASPSKGVIAEDFPYLAIAQEYEAAGAAAVSVLTEPDYFLGSDKYLFEIATTIQIPTLRKDFIIKPYQIYQAKLLRAEAVLLICALLDAPTLAEYIAIAAELDMAALVEIHDETEARMAVEAGARIIGINNRDLKNFTVDFNTSARLRECIPGGMVTVAESGVKCPTDVRQLSNAGFDAVLIGESVMMAKDKRQFLKELKAAYNED